MHISLSVMHFLEKLIAGKKKAKARADLQKHEIKRQKKFS